MNHADNLFRSASNEAVWPGLLPTAASRLAATVLQLEQTQWWSGDTITQQQGRQLKALLLHAQSQVPAYEQRLGNVAELAEQGPLSEAWRQVPLLTRDELQRQGTAFRARTLSRLHGTPRATRTSGSTGQALETYGTDLTQLLWMAFTMREHYWHRRDFRRKLAVIRYFSTSASTPGTAKQPPRDGLKDNWGAPVTLLHQTGPAAVLNVNTDIADQLAWLERHQPAYLLTYPSNLRALATHCLERGNRLKNLQELRTISEIVTDDLRELCREAFGTEIVDVYSSNEAGQIAQQCPDCGQYHVQAENVLCEIIDDQGQTCGPGDIGRVILTPLHNFAMPLLRYEIGDYAEIGEAGRCPRGLPALVRILGRQRNMLTLPNGQQRWPTGLLKLRDLADIAQFQVIQHTRDHVELKLVVRTPLTPRDEQRIQASLISTWGHPFTITFSYVDALRGNDRGKFEEFISLLP